MSSEKIYDKTLIDTVQRMVIVFLLENKQVEAFI